MIKYLGIKEIIAGVTFLIGVVSFVYSRGAKDAIKENSSTKIESAVTELNRTVMSQGRMIIHFDSTLTVHLGNTQKDKKDFQTLLQNYSNFVQANTRTVQEWKEYMNGLTFEVVTSEPNKSMDFPDTKIKITPIKK